MKHVIIFLGALLISSSFLTRTARCESPTSKNEAVAPAMKQSSAPSQYAVLLSNEIAPGDFKTVLNQLAEKFSFIIDEIPENTDRTGFIATISQDGISRLVNDPRVVYIENVGSNLTPRNPKCPPHCKWNMIWGICICR